MFLNVMIKVNKKCSLNRMKKIFLILSIVIIVNACSKDNNSQKEEKQTNQTENESSQTFQQVNPKNKEIQTYFKDSVFDFKDAVLFDQSREINRRENLSGFQIKITPKQVFLIVNRQDTTINQVVSVKYNSQTYKDKSFSFEANIKTDKGTVDIRRYSQKGGGIINGCHVKQGQVRVDCY